MLQQVKSDPASDPIPVVIMTSSKEEQGSDPELSPGVNSYIRKPVDFDQTWETVKQTGLYWMLVNQPPPANT